MEEQWHTTISHFWNTASEKIQKLPQDRTGENESKQAIEK